MSDKKRSDIEEMAQFFNMRAAGYDEHMRGVVKSFDDFYSSVAKPILSTEESLNILDLGCGTGLEIKWIFQKAPRSTITGIDMSEKMLNLLIEKYPDYTGQIKTITGSYLSLPFPEGHYDYIVSVMTMHHLLYDDKLKLYQKIFKALKPGGKYIEGDYIETPEFEKRLLEDYRQVIEQNNLSKDYQYHLDIPCSIVTEEKLLEEAGFSGFQVFWEEGKAAIYEVKKIS